MVFMFLSTACDPSGDIGDIIEVSEEELDIIQAMEDGVTWTGHVVDVATIGMYGWTHSVF